MGTTPKYAFPFPALTDAPNGPQQFQALAQKVEDIISRLDGYFVNGGLDNLIASTTSGGTGSGVEYKQNFIALSGTMGTIDTGDIVIPKAGRYYAHQSVAVDGTVSGQYVVTKLFKILPGPAIQLIQGNAGTTGTAPVFAMNSDIFELNAGDKIRATIQLTQGSNVFPTRLALIRLGDKVPGGLALAGSSPV